MIENSFYVIFANSKKGIIEKSDILPINIAHKLYKQWADNRCGGRIVVTNEYREEVDQYDEEWYDKIIENLDIDGINRLLKRITCHSYTRQGKIGIEVRMLHSSLINDYKFEH